MLLLPRWMLSASSIRNMEIESFWWILLALTTLSGHPPKSYVWFIVGFRKREANKRVERHRRRWRLSSGIRKALNSMELFVYTEFQIIVWRNPWRAFAYSGNYVETLHWHRLSSCPPCGASSRLRTGYQEKRSWKSFIGNLWLSEAQSSIASAAMIQRMLGESSNSWYNEMTRGKSRNYKRSYWISGQGSRTRMREKYCKTHFNKLLRNRRVVWKKSCLKISGQWTQDYLENWPGNIPGVKIKRGRRLKRYEDQNLTWELRYLSSSAASRIEQYVLFSIVIFK